MRFSSEGEMKIDVRKCVCKMHEDFPDDGTERATAPAALHSFEICKDVDKLSEEDAVVFHNVVVRGLFVCKQARPDVQTAVPFLTTCVSEPDNDDLKKLG